MSTVYNGLWLPIIVRLYHEIRNRTTVLCASSKRTLLEEYLIKNYAGPPIDR